MLPYGERIEIDGADLWPRYYFDLDCAKLEIAAWLRVRGIPATEWVEVNS